MLTGYRVLVCQRVTLREKLDFVGIFFKSGGQLISAAEFLKRKEKPMNLTRCFKVCRGGRQKLVRKRKNCALLP